MHQQRTTFICLLVFSLFLTTPVAAEDPEAQARRLLNALGCKGCHSFEQDGGSLAPVLDQVGSRLTQEQIEKHLAAHTESRKQSFMPSFGTTAEKDLKILSDFLYQHQ